MQTFSFNPPLKLIKEGNWLLGVTSLECTNSFFNITNGNNSFSIIIPGHYQTESAEKTIDELNKIVELRSVDLHVNEVRKGGIKKNWETVNTNCQTLILKNMSYLKN